MLNSCSSSQAVHVHVLKLWFWRGLKEVAGISLDLYFRNLTIAGFSRTVYPTFDKVSVIDLGCIKRILKKVVFMPSHLSVHQ